MLVGCGCKGSNHYEVITTTDWIQKAAGIRLDCLNVLEMDKGVRDALILGKLNATVCQAEKKVQRKDKMRDIHVRLGRQESVRVCLPLYA